MLEGKAGLGSQAGDLSELDGWAGEDIWWWKMLTLRQGNPKTF